MDLALLGKNKKSSKKEYRTQNTGDFVSRFAIKKLIKLLLFLTDKVLERDRKGIAQSQPGPAECERMNNFKNVI